jgi:Na+-exporting ATPase
MTEKQVHHTEKKSFSRADTGDTAVSQSLPFAPHTVKSSQVLDALNADVNIGLSESDVLQRQQTYGPNRLKPPQKPSVLKIVFRQIGNAMTLVLSEWRAVECV